jgi:hypothetical protein
MTPAEELALRRWAFEAAALPNWKATVADANVLLGWLFGAGGAPAAQPTAPAEPAQ